MRTTMTKRMGWVLALALVWPLSFAQAAEPVAKAGEPVEGRDYQVLPERQPVETGDKIEVREFFWYGCPHCYALEPKLVAYVKKLPSNVQFIRTPGVAGGWRLHAQAYFAFETLHVTSKLHSAFFEAVHAKKPEADEKAPMSDEESIAEFVAQHGVDKEKFLQAFRSFGVRNRLERAKQINVKYTIDSVPTIVVDGRYKTSPYMAKSEEGALRVVDYLIQKAAKERHK